GRREDWFPDRTLNVPPVRSCPSVVSELTLCRLLPAGHRLRIGEVLDALGAIRLRHDELVAALSDEPRLTPKVTAAALEPPEHPGLISYGVLIARFSEPHRGSPEGPLYMILPCWLGLCTHGATPVQPTSGIDLPSS